MHSLEIEELIKQSKIVLGILSVIGGVLPPDIGYHLNRAGLKIKGALEEVIHAELDMEDMGHLATLDLLDEWRQGEDLPENMRRLVNALYENYQEKFGGLLPPTQNTPVDNPIPVDDIWDIWKDETL